MSDASTNAGMHNTLNIARVRSQRYTKDAAFWLAEMTLCVLVLSNFPLFVGPNVILDRLTKRISYSFTSIMLHGFLC